MKSLNTFFATFQFLMIHVINNNNPKKLKKKVSSDFTKFYIRKKYFIYSPYPTWYTFLLLPIMSSETVRCSLPEAFMAPRTVPTIEQQMPTKAIMTMNHRIDTVWVTMTPQHDFWGSESSPKTEAWDLKYQKEKKRN